MASHRVDGGDLRVDIRSPGRGKADEGAELPEEQTKIALVYGRRRIGPPADAPLNVSGRESDGRPGFAPSKRISWNRSLSTRGRTSIVLAAGTDFRAPPRPKDAKKKNKRTGVRKKRPGKRDPPDFVKEKAYFEEVDAFELLEESPSPRKLGTWAMGLHNNDVMDDLPGILERWKLSKVAYHRTPSPLFRITETPVMASGSTCSELSHFSNAKTEKMSLEPAEVENSLISSLDALSIRDNVSTKMKELKVANKGLEEAVKFRSTSLAGECQDAFTQLLTICRQAVPLTLTEVVLKYCDPGCVIKLGEGTYGEAFRAGSTVCKVVPIDGDALVNGEVQKRSAEVLEEVLLSLTLNGLRKEGNGKEIQNACSVFIETKKTTETFIPYFFLVTIQFASLLHLFHICRGAYDVDLINAWEDWDAKHGSENDHPKEFSEGQCYIIFALSDGGRDLESFVLLCFDEARSLLVQVTAGLAVAEIACEFEHRDLHWGNILLTRKEAQMTEFTIKGRKMLAKTYGLAVAIIDFTLSRINTGDAVLFFDLSADPALFEGPKGDRQSETYRKMKEVTEECWENSFPKTNVLWLQYLVDILLSKKSFKRTTKDERELRSFKKRLNSCDSANDALSDNFFTDLLVDEVL